MAEVFDLSCAESLESNLKRLESKGEVMSTMLANKPIEAPSSVFQTEYNAEGDIGVQEDGSVKLRVNCDDHQYNANVIVYFEPYDNTLRVQQVNEMSFLVVNVDKSTDVLPVFEVISEDEIEITFNHTQVNLILMTNGVISASLSEFNEKGEYTLLDTQFEDTVQGLKIIRVDTLLETKYLFTLVLKEDERLYTSVHSTHEGAINSFRDSIKDGKADMQGITNEDRVAIDNANEEELIMMYQELHENAFAQINRNPLNRSIINS